eukprot:TRINITY_DN1220_c0_g1_i1.p2 TRINITY_DN1220_c0_g1~~TRINITY_DN1220_c0_g1_i1.p2  ORF type:complete len:108 (-),score=6.18 TRINITY_DN1220_c0_g1_i1:2-325(-)
MESGSDGAAEVVREEVLVVVAGEAGEHSVLVRVGVCASSRSKQWRFPVAGCVSSCTRGVDDGGGVPAGTKLTAVTLAAALSNCVRQRWTSQSAMITKGPVLCVDTTA